MTPEEPFDPDHDLLVDLLKVLDGHWVQIEADVGGSPDPDSLGEFDRGEHLIGLAFIACQTYIAGACGRKRVNKSEALVFGECVSPGLTRAALVNHAANYWKHHLEPGPGDDVRRERIVEAFNGVGIPRDASYPLSNVLAALVGQTKSPLLKLGDVVFEWGRAVEPRGRRTRG